MRPVPSSSITRRAALAAGAGLLAAPALAQPVCELGLPGHIEGSHVWRDYDQDELDAAYDQEFYQPHTEAVNSRLSSLSFDLRLRRGWPERAVYGEHPDEGMDIYKAASPGGPVFLFVHGGTWRFLDASSAGFAAEMFLDRGAYFVALDFSDVREVGGDWAPWPTRSGAGSPGSWGTPRALAAIRGASMSAATPRAGISRPWRSPPTGRGSACLPTP